MRNNCSPCLSLLIQLLIFTILVSPIAYAAKNQKPMSNAGVDVTVGLSSIIKLDGTESIDPDGVIAKYQWIQTQGKKVKLGDAKTATPSFVSFSALKKNKPVKLVFNLTVTDNKKAKKSDKVTVTVDSATPSCVSPQFFKNGVCTASVGQETKTKVQQLAAGYMHTCALLSDNTVKCWGDNYYGELGLEHRDEVGNDPNEMGANLQRVNLGVGVKVSALAQGDEHTCALLDDNTVKCWGINDHGQLGLGDTVNRGGKVGDMGDNLARVDLGTQRTAKAISAGHSSTCALLDNNTIKCWGENASGQLGLGDTLDRGDNPGEMGDDLPGIDLGSGQLAKSLKVGYSHVCALLEDYTIKCWGSGSFGTLGIERSDTLGDDPDEMGDNLPRVLLGANHTAKSLSSGKSHVCALLDDNSVKCWGGNLFGQLGRGDKEFFVGNDADEMGDNLSVVDFGVGRTAKRVESSNDHTCAILDNDAVKCWGVNGDGQLGLGDILSRGDDLGEMGENLVSVALGTGRTAKDITTGQFHTCALLDNDAVKCWGANRSMGLLGLEDEFDRGDEPGEMGDLLPFVDLGL